MRFEFSLPWSEYTYKELFDIISNKNKEGLNLPILSASQALGMIEADKLNLNIKREATNYDTWKIIDEGDYVIHLRSFQGGYAYTNKKGICCPAYTVLRPNNLVVKGFYESFFNSKRFINSLIPYIYGIRDGKSIMINEWMQDKCYLPSHDEQLKIVEFLKLIKERINTQMKIINNLKSLIISIKNREFYNSKGYNEKLENILIEINDKTIINNQYEVLSSTIKGIVKQSEYFDRTVASENNIGYKIVNRGNIVVSPQNLWMGNISYNDKFEVGIVSPSYKIFNVNNNFNEQYIFEMLTTKKSLYLFKTISEQGASIVRRNLNYEAFMQLTFNIPSLNKQNEFIEKLNLLQDKLCLENKILSLFEKQKQYLLNKLFI